MDFGNLKINLDAVPMHLEHPVTGQPMDGPEDAVFFILPPQSDKVVEVDKKFRNKLLKNKKVLGSADDFDTHRLELLVACIDSWKNVRLEGKELECNPHTIREFFSIPELSWVREQIEAFINDQQNFFKKA